MQEDQIKKQQLQKDISQIKKLIFYTQNQRVGEYLAEKLSLIKTQLELIVTNSVKPIQKVKTNEQSKFLDYVTLSKFAWESIGQKQIKILIQFKDIKKTCELSQIQTQFLPTSIKINIHNYQNRNYIFGISRLYSQIIPQKCSFNLSQNYLNIKLTKKVPIDWIDVHLRKDIFNQKKGDKQNRKQPIGQQDKLMDMVKKMYQDGDPKMQKIIKQAFDSAADKRKQ